VRFLVPCVLVLRATPILPRRLRRATDSRIDDSGEPWAGTRMTVLDRCWQTVAGRTGIESFNSVSKFPLEHRHLLVLRTSLSYTRSWIALISNHHQCGRIHVRFLCKITWQWHKEAVRGCITPVLPTVLRPRRVVTISLAVFRPMEDGFEDSRRRVAVVAVFGDSLCQSQTDSDFHSEVARTTAG
jgi:hypothetical protein